MPIVSGSYVNPGWTNNTSPAIDKTELDAMSNAIVTNQTNIATNTQDISTNTSDIADNTTAISTNAASIVNLKSGTLTFLKVAVLVSAWVSNSTFASYPYAAVISCNGVTASHVPMVSFQPTEAVNGNYAPLAVSGAGTVTIYAKQIPAGTITLGSIACLKATA